MSFYADRHQPLAGFAVSPARPWIAGVCATLAAKCGIAPWIIRLAALALLLWHPAAVIVLYVAAAVLARKGGPPWRRRFNWSGFNWPGARREPAFAPGGESGLAALTRRLAALDRRLDALEATINEPDYGLRQKFRNL